MKNYKLMILTLSALFLLQACTDNMDQSTFLVESLNNYKNVRHEKYLYEIAIPEGTDDSFFTEEYDSYTKEIVFNIDGGSAHFHHSPPSCSSNLTAISEPLKVEDTGGNSIWGKVYEERGMGGTPNLNALCRYPQASRECESIGEGCDDGTGAYAFCSEKDDKRVVICISQQTDDSKMAEEIFKTFKWIK